MNYNRDKCAKSNGSSLEIHLENNSLGYYLDQIGRSPIPNYEEQLSLARAVKVSQEAEEIAKISGNLKQLAKAQMRTEQVVNKMVQANLRLVPPTARKYIKYPRVDLWDLIQAGNMGLIRAVEKFNPERGFKFSTYADDWIKQPIKNL